MALAFAGCSRFFEVSYSLSATLPLLSLRLLLCQFVTWDIS